MQKHLAVESYAGKANAQQARVGALISERKLKLEIAENKILQAFLKVESDSIDLEAAETNLRIAKIKYDASRLIISRRIHSEKKKLRMKL